MNGDVVASRELKSLQEELSATERERSAAASVPPTTPRPGSVEPGEPPEESQRELWDQLRDLTGEVTNFFEEAEKSISAHPTQSIVSALLVGIFIGRLLGRR